MRVAVKWISAEIAARCGGGNVSNMAVITDAVQVAAMLR
jgi:hypothetical protein